MDKNAIHRGIVKCTQLISDYTTKCNSSLEKLKNDSTDESVFFNWEAAFWDVGYYISNQDNPLERWVEDRKIQITTLEKRAEVALNNYEVYFEPKDYNFEESFTNKEAIKQDEIRRDASYLSQVSLAQLSQLYAALVEMLPEQKQATTKAPSLRQRQPGEKTQVLSSKELATLLGQFQYKKLFTVDNDLWISEAVAPLCGYSVKGVYELLIDPRPTDKNKEKIIAFLQSIIDSLK